MKEPSFCDLKNKSGKQIIFLPFTIDKRFWNKDMPNVFLNKVYEAQIDGEEKSFQFTTLITSYTYKNDKNFQKFCVNLTNALGHILNHYHGLNESTVFWKKVLYEWVVDYSSSIRFKIEQFNNLLLQYPRDSYSYCSYRKKAWENFIAVDNGRSRTVFMEEEYNFFTYCWIAQRYFGVCVEEKDIEGDVKSKKKKNIQFSLYYFAKLLYRAAGAIRRLLMKMVPSRLFVGTYAAQYGLFSSTKWFLWSMGKIQEIVIECPQIDCKVDFDFRNRLLSEILEYIDTNQEDRIILELLPKIMPMFFIENFKVQYNAANDFLATHPNMLIIYTLTGMVGQSVEKICMLLLQKRGGKVLGQQHGGTYQVTTSEQEKIRELELNDIFYYWGKSALSYMIKDFPDCKILFGPTHKLSKDIVRPFISCVSSRFKWPAEYILFTGTALEAYPRSYHYGNSTGEQLEYLYRKNRFFSHLFGTSRKRMLVREYPVDYGWHISERIEKEFLDLCLPMKERFDVLLKGCSLYISDHLSTTWIEALFLEKPMILLLFDHEISIQNYKFRIEEKPYIDLLANTGIIVFSPEEAADLVNRLVENGIMDWWMDEERQRVIRLVRERWMTKVDDVDAWWCRELITQYNKIESERREMNP